MEAVMGEHDGSVNRAGVRPSGQDRCAECGVAVGEEWTSYRQDPTDPQKIIRHFAGIVFAKLVEPHPDLPTRRTTRDFRYPQDLGIFFHSSCAPRIKLPE